MADRELKFTCPPSSDRMMLSSLRNRCRADDKYRFNQVNSIYFDTENWAFADEKAASDYLKTKVRIRWYGEPDSEPSADETKAATTFLEIKRKIGSTRKKIRIPLSLTATELLSSLSEPEMRGLIHTQVTAAAPELGNVDLQPGILVRYHRRRFIDPLSGARIAYDSHISGTAVGRAAVKRFTVLLDQSVLEVKGSDQDMPVSLRYLNTATLKKAAFSKYYECYCRLTGYQQ